MKPSYVLSADEIRIVWAAMSSKYGGVSVPNPDGRAAEMLCAQLDALLCGTDRGRWVVRWRDMYSSGGGLGTAVSARPMSRAQADGVIACLARDGYDGAVAEPAPAGLASDAMYCRKCWEDEEEFEREARAVRAARGRLADVDIPGDAANDPGVV